MKALAKLQRSKLVADTVQCFGNVSVGAQTRIHEWSILGFPNRDPNLFSNENDRIVRIGRQCVIYPWCLIYEGASISPKVEIHERCMVGSLTAIGTKSLILYGAQLHDRVKIGRECIIAGFVADNCTVGDGSTVFGALVHRYGQPGRKRWDSTDEQGPVLGKNVVVGWGAVVIGPVKIGDGARIAPNAVVRADIAAGERYA